jgi:hypothetical protein
MTWYERYRARRRRAAWYRILPSAITTKSRMPPTTISDLTWGCGLPVSEPGSWIGCVDTDGVARAVAADGEVGGDLEEWRLAMLT